MELFLTPLPQTPQGYLPDSSTTLEPTLHFITFVFPTFTFSPFISSPAFHFLIFSNRLSSDIRKCIDYFTANTIACSFVASRFDYFNCVYAGMPDYSIKRLQRVQNYAARIVKM